MVASGGEGEPTNYIVLPVDIRGYSLSSLLKCACLLCLLWNLGASLALYFVIIVAVSLVGHSNAVWHYDLWRSKHFRVLAYLVARHPSQQCWKNCAVSVH